MPSQPLPPGRAAGSWGDRPALGQAGKIGQLYDGRNDNILGASILKVQSRFLPKRSVESTYYNSFTYEATLTDSLEEKFSKLHLSADFKASLICGMLKGGWGIDYVSSQKTDSRNVRASVICKAKTKTEDILLTNDELREHLDLEALHTACATHVICGIEWGAQTIVTAETTITDTDKSREFGLNIGRGKEEDSGATKRGFVKKVIDAVGKAHASGKAGWDSTFKSKASSLKFKIISDVGDPGVPRSVDDVLNFLEGSKSEINKLNDAKGVPITFHLRPVDDIANRFSVSLQHDTILHSLDQGFLDSLVQLFEKRRAVRLELETYYEFVRERSFCVPDEQIEKAEDQATEAATIERDVSKILRAAVEGIRSGRLEKRDMKRALARGNSKGNPSNYPSILKKYLGKIRFAEEVKHKGAIYVPNDPADLDRATMSCGKPDTYVLFYNEALQHHSDWNENRQKITELLDNMDGTYSVAVADCDLGDDGEVEKPVIEQRRDGKIIVTDMVEDHRQLEGICLVKCSDESGVYRSRSVKKPSQSRIARLPCPIRLCHASGTYRWTCPDCRTQVWYGFTDEYLYCQCSRYHYSLAVFRCKNPCHGKEYVSHDTVHLGKLLAALETEERYNILLLGETGVGKSMFLNAFNNYLKFESLGEAMADPNDLQFLIPCYFTHQENHNDMAEKREIVVGKATQLETQSRGGESGTTEPGVYTFWIGDRRVDFIDTPGIGDTDGYDQDVENMRRIMKVLAFSTVKKLSAVLILMRPDQPRLTQNFQYCLKQLFHHLHADVARNILFGFTNSHATNYTLGATITPLRTLLSDLRMDITLGHGSQFFFDSRGFMLLADHKLNNPIRPRSDRHSCEMAWRHSADEAHRLLTTAMALHDDAHDVKKTLEMNRIRWALETMVRPLAEFTSDMKLSQASLHEEKEEIQRIDLKSEEAAENLKKSPITITVPERRSLKPSRVVCGHRDCCKKHVFTDGTGKEYVTYNKVCHDNCDLGAPEGVRRAEKLYWCYAFRQFIFRGYDCDNCDHDYTEHVYISSEYYHVDKEVPNEKYVGELRSLEERRYRAERLVSEREDVIKTMAEEEEQVKATQARICVYLKKNALVAYNDATYDYITRCIKSASDYSERYKLEQQRNEHKELVEALSVDIDSGTTSELTAEDVNRAIEDLKAMKIFGRFLAAALEQDERERRARDTETYHQVTASSWAEGVRRKLLKRFWWGS